MTKKTHSELREIFEHFDRDQSGAIDANEFQTLLTALGGGFTPEEVQIGLDQIDKNRNGRIEFEEFARWWADGAGR